MKKSEKFYDAEQPELVTIKGGELRLYGDGLRLAVSKPQWIDGNGDYQMGKTVSVDLASNKGNVALIELLLKAVELLR